MTRPLAVARRALVRVREIFQRDRLHAELDDELRFHLEMETEQNVRRGMSPATAARAARIALGGVNQVREETRAARGVEGIERAVRDMRFALRRLRRDPHFTIPTVLTLGLGIGAATAIGSFVVAVLIRPLPYPSSNRLVALRHSAVGLGIADGGQSGGTFAAYRDHARTLEAVGVYMESDAVSITDGDVPERVRVAMITPSVLPMLGAHAVAGRLFGDTDLGGPDEATSVMLSARLWRRRYGADPNVVGRRLSFNRHAFTVTGILDSAFDFPNSRTEIWYAVALDPHRGDLAGLDWNAIARIRPGVSTTDVQVDLARVAGSFPELFPDVTREQLSHARLRPLVEPLRSRVTRDARPMLLLLAATSLLVLVIACANIANLFLIRGERAGREVAIARALGAGTPDLVRRFVVEGLVLGFGGGLLGFAIAAIGIRSRFGFDKIDIARLHELRVDAVPVGIAMGLAVVIGAALGVASFARTRGGELGSAAKGLGRTTSTRGWRRAQRVIVAAQVALALTLLAGAALMSATALRMRRANLGFDAGSALTFQLTLPFRNYEKYQFATDLYERIASRLRATSGVRSVEATETLPLDGAGGALSASVEGIGAGAIGHDAVDATVNFATPGYFSNMRIVVASGRIFHRGDLGTGTPPVILSRALAQRLFAAGDAIGRTVRFSKYPTYPTYKIVGVVENVLGESIASGPSRMLYFPLLPDLGRDTTVKLRVPSNPGMPSFIVRSDALPTSLLSEIRRVVHDADPQLAVTRVRTLADIVDAASARARLLATLLAFAAGAAVMLGVVGVYSVASYAADQRRREIGVRVALGATPANVSVMLLRQGVVAPLAGIVAGLAGAALLGRLLRGLLYEISSSDPLMISATAAILLVIALGGSWLPARRAARADPMRALRSD